MIILFAFSTIIGLRSDENANESFREVILFADANSNVYLKEQLVILNSDAKGLAERDIKVTIHIWDKKKSTAYQKYKIPENKFAMVLIGKDGGEKYRSEKVVTLQKLYATIDTMPMRVYEMRNQK